MTKTMNIILICVLIIVSVWCIYQKNWYILISNICIITGVLIDDRTTKSLQKKEANVKFLQKLQKLPFILYVIGAISFIIYGYTKYLE